jgi:zinc protease
MALYELRKLVTAGISLEDFEATRRFLTKFANVLVGTQDSRLGYALDSRIYNIPEFPLYVKEQLAGLTIEDVNRSIRQYLQPDNVKIVVVTQDPESFRQAALEDSPSPITYASPMPQQVLDEDKKIENYHLRFTPDRISIIAVDDVFQKP